MIEGSIRGNKGTSYSTYLADSHINELGGGGEEPQRKMSRHLDGRSFGWRGRRLAMLTSPICPSGFKPYHCSCTAVLTRVTHVTLRMLTRAEFDAACKAVVDHSPAPAGWSWNEHPVRRFHLPSLPHDLTFSSPYSV